MNPIQLTSQELWLFIRVFCLSYFMISFGIHWAQKADVTKAHKLLGLVTLFIMAFMLMVISFDNTHAYIVGPLFSLTFAIWFNFDSWYFYKLPGLKQWLADPNRPLGTFGLNTWLGRLLVKRDLPDPATVEAETVRPLVTWKTLAITMAGLFVFALLFGFSRVLNTLVLTGKVNAKATVRAEQKTKQAIDTAVKRTGEQFATEINSLSATTSRLVESFTANAVATNAKLDRNAGKTDKATAEARRAAQLAAQAARRAASRPIYVPATPIKPLPPTGVIPLNKAPVYTPVPANRPEKRRRPGKNQTVSYGEELDEDGYYVRGTANENDRQP